MGGGGGWQTNAGGREKECYLVGQRIDMFILRGRAQPKKSESLNQIVSCYRHFFLSNKGFTHLLVIWRLHSIQSKSKKRLIFTVGESVTHSKPFSKRFYRFVVCLLIDLLVGSSMFLYWTTICVGQSVFVFWVTSEWKMSDLFSCEEDKCPNNFVYLRIFVLLAPLWMYTLVPDIENVH